MDAVLYRFPASAYIKMRRPVQVQLACPVMRDLILPSPKRLPAAEREEQGLSRLAPLRLLCSSGATPTSGACCTFPL